MQLNDALQFVPTFVLVFFRLAGLMIFAPLLGSGRIPRRVKIMLALVLALGMTSSVKTPAVLPDSLAELTMGIVGEMLFGIGMGMCMSFVFIAAQWAGEMMGQQMGLNMSQVLDPQFGGGGSLIGDLNFMLTLVVFLCVRGHHAMLRALASSFQELPLLLVGINASLLDVTITMFKASTVLALQLAAPMLVTMIVVDMVMGFLGKTMPQLNIMTMGLAIRAMVGMAVLLLSMTLTSNLMQGEVLKSMNFVQNDWVKISADSQSAGEDAQAAPTAEGVN